MVLPVNVRWFVQPSAKAGMGSQEPGKAARVSDLDFDELIHTPEGRLVLEVLQQRRLPLVVALQDRGEVVWWYPPAVLANLTGDSERMLEWIRLLEGHIEQLSAMVVRQ